MQRRSDSASRSGLSGAERRLSREYARRAPLRAQRRWSSSSVSPSVARTRTGARPAAKAAVPRIGAAVRARLLRARGSQPFPRRVVRSRGARGSAPGYRCGESVRTRGGRRSGREGGRFRHRVGSGPRGLLRRGDCGAAQHGRSKRRDCTARGRGAASRRGLCA